MNRRLFGILGALAAALLGSGLLAPPAAHADKVICKNGQVVEGRIIEETPEGVKLEIKRGSIVGYRTVERAEIKEIVREALAEEKWQKALEAGKTADDLVKVAAQAKADAPKIALKALERALKLDPKHAGAREALKKEGWKEDPKTGQLLSPEEQKKAGGGAGKKGEAEKGAADYGKELEGTGEWFYVETKSKRYKIKCNSTKAVAERYADFVDKIVLEYDKVFKGRKHFWEGQSLIYIFRNNEDFRQFMQVEQGVGGFYMAKAQGEYPDRIVAAYHGAFGTGDTRMVLAHECTHQYEHILSNGEWMEFYMRPAWWMEGYATYFGDGYVLDKKNNLSIQIPRMRLNPIQEAVKAGYIPEKVPISEFMKWGLREYQMKAGLAYPYGWSLIYYFHKRCEVPGKKKGTVDYKPIKVKVDGKDREVNLYKVLNDFFDKIAQKPPESAGNRETGEGFPEYYLKELEKLLGFPVDALGDDWKDFVLKLEAPTMGKIDKSKGKFSGTEAGFEIELPKLKGWKWNEEDCVGDDAIRLENPETTGLVRIEVDGNMANLPLAVGPNDPPGTSTVCDEVEKRIGPMWGAPTIDSSRKISVAGIDSAWEYLYNGTEQAHVQGQKVRSGEQRIRHIVIGGATFKRTFQIFCVAEKDKFAENEAAFDKILSTFKMLKDN